MKKIVGLDLGTNSIGWAVVTENNNSINIDNLGSRVIPMDRGSLKKYSGGKTLDSSTKARRELRSKRRLIERSKLRRERLFRVLDILGLLPPHFSLSLDSYGKIKKGYEEKIAWRRSEDGSQDFLFKDAFEEMLIEFKQFNPNIFTNEDILIPYDWTLYYLRKKGLTERLSDYELAWVLHSFNKKRGYYQSRDEEVSNSKEYLVLKVVDVQECIDTKNIEETNYDESVIDKLSDVDRTQTYKKKSSFKIILENGLSYELKSEIPLYSWIGVYKEFIITKKILASGEEEITKIELSNDKEWQALRLKSESDINNSGKTVGEYIYSKLLINTSNQFDPINVNPTNKIIGNLVKVIERSFYKNELSRILDKQIEFNPKLRDECLYHKCIESLYKSNITYRNSISKNGFKYLFIEDIIYYQRKLKKNEVANCPYEKIIYKNGSNDIERKLKCIPKSNPVYQEYRLWKFVSDLKIIQREKIDAEGKILFDIDVTYEFLPDDESKSRLFDWLNKKETVKQIELFKSFFKCKAEVLDLYRWNFVEEKVYPANITRYTIVKALKKANLKESFLNKSVFNDRISKRSYYNGSGLMDTSIEYNLWQILYTISDKYELETALRRFSKKYELGELFVEVFKEIKPFEVSYGAYSEKAIKKILSLMRLGSYWSGDAIDSKTMTNIDKLLNGECDENIKEIVREKTKNFTSVSEFSGLPEWLACYIVYNRHSESVDDLKWNIPNDVDDYINSFKQHSLNNPIVEKITLETLRVIRDIWIKYGKIDEIHIELGRDVKNSKDKREQISKVNLENERTNDRIRKMLLELSNDAKVKNIRPHSLSQHLKLKIVEEGVLALESELPGYVKDVINPPKVNNKTKEPTSKEIKKYLLWLDQRYISPYTGAVIPLARLFTKDYEIEHIIPQKLYFDDSINNKVICERNVNKLKGANLAMNFINNNAGRIITDENGKKSKILDFNSYTDLINRIFKRNKAKRERLLMTEIPTKFTTRQLNDTRYISKLVMSLMSNVVRDENETSNYISRNVIATNGTVTSRLKQDWKLNDVWNNIIKYRFERLNRINNCSDYGCIDIKDGKSFFRTSVPFSSMKGFNKKRIDHRHHALDALVIACTTRNHVNYISNETTVFVGSKRYDLLHKLCKKEKTDNQGNYKWVFIEPICKGFQIQVEDKLKNMIISFKQNLRVVANSSNRTAFIASDGSRKYKKQERKNVTIRKSLHTDTFYGYVNLKQINDGDKFVAIRKDIFKYLSISSSDTESDANKKNKTQLESIKDKIDKITDTGIQKILHTWLVKNDNDYVYAFSYEGIRLMNSIITDKVKIDKELSGIYGKLYAGKLMKIHKPIINIREARAKGSKFPLGTRGNNKDKYMIADAGTNLYFAIYLNSEHERIFESISLIDIINRIRNNQNPVHEENDAGDKLLFYLSPNDLVYVPTEAQIGLALDIKNIDYDRIYKMVSASGVQCQFIKNEVAIPIVDKEEFSNKNKMERSIDGLMIKNVCIKLEVDRLGEIINIK